MKKENLLIGAHVSIAGGFHKAILAGEEIGATCIQIFTKSNRQWKAKPITKQEIESFQAQQKNSSIQVVVAHAAYIINLGSTSHETVEKSVHALVEELKRCDALKIPYLVVHPGTMHFKDDEQKSLIFIADQINKVLDQAKPTYVTLLIETMAGQGSILGYTFKQLATIIHHIKHKKHIAVCLDTCHVFASGYTFNTPASYKKMLHDFDEAIGLNMIKAIHMNDSKKDSGTKIDRHEHIGKGKIGANAFTYILKDKKFAHVPKILETPQNDPVADNKKNMATLRHYVNN
ncbi:MAG TPA: deoxyribonuclease IV [Candidatus Saccharimonadales bacterium]|nr:deoxyribonuclease IV [Candidatus Saccharimonadales bacterium]